jgi:hypothetical protein
MLSYPQWSCVFLGPLEQLRVDWGSNRLLAASIFRGWPGCWKDAGGRQLGDELEEEIKNLARSQN